LGSTYINARLGNQIGVALITATSPGTHTVYGRVREPGRGGLAGVQVVESESGRFAISNAEGQYSIGGIRNTLLTFEKAGYELVTTTVTPDTSSDTPMQPVLRMNAGETLTAQLAPNEVRYAPRGDECECKLIRVLVGTSGTLRVTVTRSSGGELLTLWIEGYRKTDPGASLVGEHQVTPGEVLLHVGVSPRPSGPYINFSVTSELRAN
jgi:hypothetical protein